MPHRMSWELFVLPIFSEGICLRLRFLKYLIEFTSEIPWAWSLFVGNFVITNSNFVYLLQVYSDFLFLFGLSLITCVFLGIYPFHLSCLI